MKDIGPDSKPPMEVLLKVMLSFHIADIFIEILFYLHFSGTMAKEKRRVLWIWSILFCIEIVLQSLILVSTILTLKLIFSEEVKNCVDDS